MWLEILIFIVGLAAISGSYYKRLNNGKPKNGIYAQESFFYPIKFVAFLLILQLRRIQVVLAKRNSKVDPDASVKLLDFPQPFSGKLDGFDAVFFSGGNLESGECLIIATERRPNKLTYGILYFWNPTRGLYRGSWLPNTALTRSEDDDCPTIFEGGSICIQPIEPMRRWKLKFLGQVKKCSGNLTTADDDSELNFSIDMDFWSNAPIFTYDTDMSMTAAARAFAKETWNPQFFDDLKKGHQTHYEQMGSMKGKITIENETKELTMSAFRDHSFGLRRDWKLMHRYIFHHIFLENGVKAVVGVVCQPHTCSTLECGFVSWPGDGRVSALDSCDLELAYHGEGGKMPSVVVLSNDPETITLRILDNQTFDVQVKVLSESQHFLGEEREAKNIERFVKYTINGVPGCGLTEWNYRNI